MIATLTDLDEAALISILTEPKNALVKQYQKLFEMEGVRLRFSDDALKAVAAKAIKRKTGARGLRAILEGHLLDLMYDIPSAEGIEEVIINADVIEKDAAPILVKIDAKEAKSVVKKLN